MSAEAFESSARIAAFLSRMRTSHRVTEERKCFQRSSHDVLHSYRSLHTETLNEPDLFDMILRIQRRPTITLIAKSTKIRQHIS